MSLVGSVLGNGPSRELYDFQSDVVIGCNIPGEGFSVDATIICDVEMVWVLKNNPDLINCPLIVSHQAQEKMKELRIIQNFDIMDVFKTVDWYTSGHYAAMYLTKIIECDTINIWGCDSYFVNDATSTTDKIIPKSGDVFFTQWRESWNNMVQSNPQTNYIFKKVTT